MKTGGPDGLEAWCVALAACFINFVMAGLGRMSGILYVAFIDIFQVDRMQASVPFSVRSLTRNLLGPVVGIFGQKYGVRVASLTGGVIGTISAVVCFYANNILWITIMWGAINGIGTALTITLPQVILNQHFKKYRTTASGMAFSGGCVGSFLFPALIEYLLHTYGLGGTFLILAGVIMNVIPAAMILRKPSWLVTRSKKPELSKINQSAKATIENTDGRLVQDFMHKNEENSVVGGASFVSDTDPNLLENFCIDTKFLRQNNRLIALLLTSNFADRYNENKFYSYLSTSNLMRELEELYFIIENSLSNKDSAPKKMNKISKSSEFDSKSSWREIQNLEDRKEVIRKLKIHTREETKEMILSLFKKLLGEDMKNIVAIFPEDEHRCISKLIKELRNIYQLFLECEADDSVLPTNAVKQISSDSCRGKSETQTHSNTFFTHIKTAFRLHTNPLFLLICLCRSVHFMTFVPAVTIIVDFSMDKGLLEQDGKYVIAAMSFGDLLGRLCLGWVTDKEYIGLPRYMLIVMVMQGACTASLTLMYSRIGLLTLLTFFGLLQGSLFVRHPVLVSKYLGSEEQSVAMGCFNFFSGLLGFTLPSYIGYFRDTIGSYDYIFYINGACGTVVGILWLFEPFFLQCISRSNEPEARQNP